VPPKNMPLVCPEDEWSEAEVQNTNTEDRIRYLLIKKINYAI
jgi:hypothetical protein